jgi:hypothetical protein
MSRLGTVALLPVDCAVNFKILPLATALQSNKAGYRSLRLSLVSRFYRPLISDIKHQLR